MTEPLEIFLAGAPGLEEILADEARAIGLAQVEATPGGVVARADWAQLAAAHLRLRTANRILIRLGEAKITHLAQLDKWARKLDWRAFLPSGAALAVEATSKRSRLYHTGAVAERVETAARAALGAPEVAAPERAAKEDPSPFRIQVRFEKDICLVSLDASGEPLHKRGYRLDTAKAPLRETLAAAFMAACGYQGDEPVLDPMCGSGVFLTEAAEIAANQAPGRLRSFAFQSFRGHDAALWEQLLSDAAAGGREPPAHFYGYDRNDGAITAARANAMRAGLRQSIILERQAVSDLQRPDGPPGLVMVNPPYGERIGDKRALHALYAALGVVLRDRFSGWRVGLVTSEPSLAKSCGLPFQPPGPPVPHGSLKIRLYRTAPLA